MIIIEKPEYLGPEREKVVCWEKVSLAIGFGTVSRELARTCHRGLEGTPVLALWTRSPVVSHSFVLIVAPSRGTVILRARSGLWPLRTRR